MSTKAILLVHGMGEHTPPTAADKTKTPPIEAKAGSFGTEFANATTEVLQKFTKHKKDTLAKYFDIYEFNYNEFFDEIRNGMADRAKPMADRITALGGPLHLVGTLSSWEAKFGGDDFLHTHVLDVIFYAEMMGGSVRVKAGKMVAGLVKKYGVGNVHIIAHSLGTAVVHDTLALLYRPELDPEDKIPDLDPADHRLGSVWMFANVSRLMTSVTKLTDPLASAVKPGSAGCTRIFRNIRHRLDPFTWLAQFNPQPGGSWIPDNLYTTRYLNLVTNLIVDANTHSFTQYLKDPQVIAELLPTLLEADLKTTPAEIKQIANAFGEESHNEVFAALKDSLKTLPESTANITSWNEVLNAAKVFRDAIKDIEIHFPKP